jgi:hypothetical protein
MWPETPKAKKTIGCRREQHGHDKQKDFYFSKAMQTDAMPTLD